jgi:2,4-dienoyl-CoA reductase-like NADH-dependent reductase (Old Yellow Enzyme family)
MFDGSQRYFDRPEYDGSPLNLAGWAKKITGKPSMTVGGVGITQGRFDTAEAKAAALSANIAAVSARLERGEFDLVGVGRSLLHDAGWANKLRLGTSLSDYDDTSRLVLT